MTTLSDNLKSRISRLYVSEREFKDDSGKTVKFKRLILEINIKNESVDIEFKVDKKDLMLLGLADTVESDRAI